MILKRAAWLRLKTNLERLIRSPWLRTIFAAGLFALAVGLVERQMRGFAISQVLTALTATSPWTIAIAAALSAGSYLCLAGTEAFAANWTGHRLGFRRTAWISTLAYSVSNTVGFSLASGGAVRLRAYGQAGLSRRDTLELTVVAGVAVTLSGVITAGAALVLNGLVDPLSAPWSRPLPWLGVMLMVPSLLWFVAFRPTNPRWLGRDETSPRTGMRLLALSVGIGDWILSGAALYVLLPHAGLAGLAGFLAVFILGSIVSAASGVPGGIGVFEAVVLTLSSLLAPVHETAAALLLYRMIYSVGPLIIVLVILLIARLRRPHDRARRPEEPQDAGTP